MTGSKQSAHCYRHLPNRRGWWRILGHYVEQQPERLFLPDLLVTSPQQFSLSPTFEPFFEDSQHFTRHSITLASLFSSRLLAAKQAVRFLGVSTSHSQEAACLEYMKPKSEIALQTVSDLESSDLSLAQAFAL